MCGITGIWNIDGHPVERPIVDRFTDRLRHRGPDGQGTFFSKQAALGLGHRRLAILDLGPKGHQPMSYAGGRYWITHNGEIYNFLELRAELENLGHQFVSDTDTEVILAAYMQWGEDCQLRFNGMWAFAIWDDTAQSMFLSRDRFGVKPLYYLYQSQRFAFASEMKAFLALPWLAAAFDDDVVIRAIVRSNSLEGTEQSLLRGVKQLPAGHCLTLRKSAPPRVQRWWHTLEHLPIVPADFDQQSEQYRELFLDACRIRMRSDVSIGTALSGGLDSSSVLCAMGHLRSQTNRQQRLAPHWQRAFVATYPGTPQDERPYAEEVVRHTGAQSAYVEINPAKLPDYIDDCIYHCEDIKDVHFGPWFVYQRMRRDGVVVSLDGHGGDEALAGYRHYCIVAMRRALFPIPQPRRLRELEGIWHKMQPDGNASGEHKWIDLLPIDVVARWPRLYQAARRLYRGRLLRAYCLGENYHKWLPSRSQRPQPPLFAQTVDRWPHDFDSLSRRLYADFHQTMLPTILLNFDRCSMAHGVEIRAPLMDWRLVCFAFALPSTSKLGDGYSKRILREAMRGILPESIRTRTSKIGFANPHRQWLTTTLRPLVLDTVSSCRFLQSHLWAGVVIREAVERAYQRGDMGTLLHAWKFVQAARLMELFRAATTHP